MNGSWRRFLALIALDLAAGRWLEARAALGAGSAANALPRSLAAAVTGFALAGLWARIRHRGGDVAAHSGPWARSGRPATSGRLGAFLPFLGAILLPAVLPFLAPRGLPALAADGLVGVGGLLLALAWRRGLPAAGSGVLAIWAAAAAAGILATLASLPGTLTAALLPVALAAFFGGALLPGRTRHNGGPLRDPPRPGDPPGHPPSRGRVAAWVHGVLLGTAALAIWTVGSAFWLAWAPASAHGSPRLVFVAFLALAVGATAATALAPAPLLARHGFVRGVAVGAGLTALVAAVPAASALLRTSGLGVLEQLAERFPVYRGAAAPWLDAWTLAGLPFLLLGLAGGFLRAAAPPSRALAPALLAGATCAAFLAPALCFRERAQAPGFAGLPAPERWLRREAVSFPGWMRSSPLGSLVRYAGTGGKKAPREFWRWKGRWMVHREDRSSLDMAQGEWIARRLPSSGKVLFLGDPTAGHALGITGSSRELHFTIRLLAGENDALAWPDFLRERSTIVADPPLPSPAQIVEEARQEDPPWNAIVLLPAPVEDGPWIDRWSREVLRGLAGAVDPQGGGLLVLVEPAALEDAAPRRLLRTWRDVLPDGTITVLQEGYRGPTLAASSASASPDGDPSDLPVLLTAPLADLAPALEDVPPLRLGWRTLAPRAKDVHEAPHHAPSAATRGSLRDLAAALAPAADPIVLSILRSLAAHEGVQFSRSLILEGEWEHILIPREEIDALLEAIRVDATHPALRRHLGAFGELLMQKREYELVLEVFSEVLDRDPSSVDAHDFVGRTLVELLEPEPAVVHLQIVRASRPDDLEVLVKLGEAFAALERWDEAVAVLEDAWSRKADDPSLAKMLGTCLFESGDLARAEQLLQQAREAAPSDSDILELLDTIDARRAAKRTP